MLDLLRFVVHVRLDTLQAQLWALMLVVVPFGGLRRLLERPVDILQAQGAELKNATTFGPSI